MKRPNPGQVYGAKDAPFTDPSFEQSHPHLHEWLTSTEYDDRKMRVTSTLLVFVDQGVLRLCINDRDNNRSGFVTGETLEEALKTLDIMLGKDAIEWRRKQAYNQNQNSTPF